MDDNDGRAHPAPLPEQRLPGAVGHHAERHHELQHPADGVHPVDHFVQALDGVAAEQLHHEERVDQHGARYLGAKHTFSFRALQTTPIICMEDLFYLMSCCSDQHVTRSSHLKGSQHAARNQYKEPEVHVEELGDFKSHEHWENQQKQTHAEAAEVFPHTPGSTDVENKANRNVF